MNNHTAPLILAGVKSMSDVCRLKNNPMEIVPLRLLFLLIYMTIFSVAVTGNFLVVYVVMRNKRMQTVTNIFITNLAISDLLVNFTSLWLTPMYTYVGHWIWGGWLCHGLPLFQGTSIFISTLTLMAIAVDRYMVIVHNSSNMNINDRMSMRTCILIIMLIWLISLLLVMPYAYNIKLNYIQACDFMVCSEEWSDLRLKQVFGVVVMTLQFVLPFVIIGISYTAIWVFLNARRNMGQQRASETSRKKRLLRMLVVMVVLFAVCWFPFNLLNILRDLHMDKLIRPYFSFIFLFVHIISMTATCWNPILYAWMNELFRKEFLRAIPFLRNRAGESGRVRIVTALMSVLGIHINLTTESQMESDARPLRNSGKKKETPTAVQNNKEILTASVALTSGTGTVATNGRMMTMQTEFADLVDTILEDDGDTYLL